MNTEQCSQVSDMQIRKKTSIQIYKYTNTVQVKFADRPYMCYIFEKVMPRGPLWHYEITAPRVQRVPLVPHVLRVPQVP